ncbi:MAG: efflux RND transporter periplasmic adaptor subunit [Formivibrio sp.]|nr:efflux RND transporter periplasmic adaptor subunit [Formivibrio sp.]
MTQSRKRFVLTAASAAVLIAIGSFAALHVYANNAKNPPVTAPQAMAVEVATVVSRNITDWQSYSGRLEAVDRIEIRPLVSGTLTAVHFKDGALVNKGDVLFSIDPRPYAAEVNRAKAQLEAAQARAAYTASDLARSERLLADNAVSQRDHDEKQNAAREAAANLQAAQAALDSARLNLGYTQITAPVSGRVSRAEVTEGNVVAAGASSQPLTTLVSVAHIYASFDVDEQSFLKFINPARSRKGEAGAVVPAFLGLADETGFPREGRISSVDNRLDTSSGTIRVRAVFDNPDGLLLPGLYARVRLGSSTPHQALLIDEKAIGTDQDKRFVLVLDENNRTAYRQVQVGALQDGLRVIERGLTAGERIVVNGLQRTRPGEVIKPIDVAMTTAVPTPPPNAGVAATVADKRVAKTHG